MAKNRQEPTDTSTTDTSAGSMQAPQPGDFIDQTTIDPNAKQDTWIGDDSVSDPNIVNR